MTKLSRHRLLSAALALILSLPATLQAQTSGGALKALVGGTLVDGYGGPPVHRSVVLIEGDRIRAVGTLDSLEVPAEAEVISTAGMTVLPGLWDLHVHLMITGHADYDHWQRTYAGRFQGEIMPAAARQLLLAGVTSARDLGAPLDEILAIKGAIAAGEIPGPTLYVSGPFLQHRPYPGTESYRWGIDGAADARAKVRRLAEAGVDVIKLIDQDEMTMEEVQAVVDEAHRRGLPVVAHAHRPEEVRRGLRAGVDNFEHTGMATAPEYPPDVVAMIRERTAQGNLPPLFWTPTISVLFNYEYLRDHPTVLDDPSWRLGLGADVVADIERSIHRPERLPYFRMVPPRRPTLERKFHQLREAGLTLVVGTDSGVPLTFHSQSTWNELDVWVRLLGVDPMEALRAATYWPAVLMGVEDRVGTIAEGKVADIIAVRGDVLRHIGLLQNVDLVIQAGRRVK